MRRSGIAVLALLVVVAVTAPAASAATLTTDASCYQETQDVVVSGTGFAPMSVVSISRGSTALGSAQTDAKGAFRNKIDTPELPDSVLERDYTLTATDAATTATAAYRATRIAATFKPRSGNPTTLKVRFAINGFSLVAHNSSVYLHYVRPNGKVQRTIRLGTATGVCGMIAKTQLRHLFPFKASKGTWILQFDTRKSYQRATFKRRTPWVRKPVQVYAR
jgi:hypothetical protein